MKTIAEIMRDRERAAEREDRVRRLTAEWEAGEYITATDAAKEIGMSPIRFQALLRQERGRLPIEKNDLALELSGRFIMGSIEAAFYDRGVNIETDFIKIHRLDWNAYLASIVTPQPPQNPTVDEPGNTAASAPDLIPVDVSARMASPLTLPPIKKRVASEGTDNAQVQNTCRDNSVAADYVEARREQGAAPEEIARELEGAGGGIGVIGCLIDPTRPNVKAARDHGKYLLKKAK